jgi:hypothetical protein
MRLKVGERVIDYPNTMESVRSMVEDIENHLRETGTIWVEMRIDDRIIYDIDECLEYIQDHLASIQHLELIAGTEREIQDDRLLDANAYLLRAIPAVETLAGEFYQGPSQESWLRLNDLAEGLQWLLQTDWIMRESGRWPESPQDDQRMNDALRELEQAVEAEDPVLVGDLIAYEILPFFREMSSKVSQLIDKEVVRDDLN